ncbi:MAG: hypothetical protein JSV80_12020 [Acidobacteriota bacterium]|nr:MAG: hypothetical protein JSV80_12020 [Acidobacteriota bacterium]
MPRARVRWASFLALSWLLCAPTVLAFSGERPAAPRDGQVVGSSVHFYIEAKGDPELEEFYRIEIATDKEFEPDQIVVVFDMRKLRTGWSIGSLGSVRDVPERYIPQDFEGIHYRAGERLRSGSYYWRALKAVGSGDWTRIGGIEKFVIDTAPPAAVDSLRMKRNEDGEIEFDWRPVPFDVNGEYETVAGYRIYRYTRRLKRYPPATKFLVAETDLTSFRLPFAAESSGDIVYYRVQAVDEVGNEIGRPLPRAIGSFEVAFNPPNLDLLTDPEYRRQMDEE